MEVMQSGMQSQHVIKYTRGKRARKTREYCKRKARIVCEQHFSISLNRVMVAKDDFEMRHSFLYFVVTHFRILVRKFFVHLRTVYASPQKLAGPLKEYANHSLCTSLLHSAQRVILCTQPNKRADFCILEARLHMRFFMRFLQPRSQGHPRVWPADALGTRLSISEAFSRTKRAYPTLHKRLFREASRGFEGSYDILFKGTLLSNFC